MIVSAELQNLFGAAAADTSASGWAGRAARGPAGLPEGRQGCQGGGTMGAEGIEREVDRRSGSRGLASETVVYGEPATRISAQQHRGSPPQDATGLRSAVGRRRTIPSRYASAFTVAVGGQPISATSICCRCWIRRREAFSVNRRFRRPPMRRKRLWTC